jgi:hypothetical protein
MGLLEKLRETVAMHLMSEVPLGAFLSGGVDSSAVVGIMAGLLDQPVNTASIGFREADFDELPYAREVAQRFRRVPMSAQLPRTPPRSWIPWCGTLMNPSPTLRWCQRIMSPSGARAGHRMPFRRWRR